MDHTIVLLAKVGLCLFQIQRVERTISACIAALPGLKGIELSADDFMRPESAKRRYTLGQLLAPIKSGIPLGELDARLTFFLQARNEFIHRHWAELTSSWPLIDLSYTKEIQYIEALTEEAIELESVFRGLFGVIVATVAKTEGVSVVDSYPGLVSALAHQPAFFSALGALR